MARATLLTDRPLNVLPVDLYASGKLRIRRSSASRQQELLSPEQGRVLVHMEQVRYGSQAELVDEGLGPGLDLAGLQLRMLGHRAVAGYEAVPASFA